MVAQSTKVSREHTVTEVAPGMSAIAGGKLTTYRVMAADAVDFALGDRAQERPSVTETIALVGAEGYRAIEAGRDRYAQRYGWDEDRITHLLERYGAQIEDLGALIDADPDLGKPLKHAPQFFAPMSCSLFATRVPCTSRMYWFAACVLTLNSVIAGWLRPPRSLRLCVPNSVGRRNKPKKNSISTRPV